MIDEASDSIDPLRVACVGASLTFGLGLQNRRQECYPAVLQNLCENEFGQGSVIVKNYGYSGATISRKSNEPYWDTTSFNSSTRSRAHLILLMLGTNDAQFANAEGRLRINQDLRELIIHYQHSGSLCSRLGWSQPQVLIAQVPPVVPPVEEIDFSSLQNTVRPAIQKTAEELEVPLIDFYTPLPATREAFPDGLHPTAEIASQIAHIAFQAILPSLEPLRD